jgi:hypothetical protein
MLKGAPTFKGLHRTFTGMPDGRLKIVILKIVILEDGCGSGLLDRFRVDIITLKEVGEIFGIRDCDHIQIFRLPDWAGRSILIGYSYAKN